MADDLVYWKNLERSLQAQHPGDLRTLAVVRHALALAQEGLALLAQVGHQFHLAQGHGVPAPEWPRMLFHIDAAPNGRLVSNEWDAIDLGPGWYDTLEAAQHWDGVDTQFTLKSGKPRHGVPVTLADGPVAELLFPQYVLDAKAKLAAARLKGIPLDDN